MNYGNQKRFNINVYIEIYTWTFPFQPGYHPETPYQPETQSRIDIGRGMIWERSCINLFIICFKLFYEANKRNEIIKCLYMEV
jgi:hypothetical protein